MNRTTLTVAEEREHRRRTRGAAREPAAARRGDLPRLPRGESGLRRAPTTARPCAQQAGPSTGCRTNRAPCDLAAAGLSPPARRPGQRARIAAAIRGGRAVLRAGAPARASPAADAQEARPGARRARSRPEADEAFEEFFESDSAIAARLRWPSITCGPAGARRRSITCAARCGRTRTMSTPCASWRSITGSEKQHLSDAEALLRRATTLAPGYTAAWTLLGLHAPRARSPRGSRSSATGQRHELEPDNAVAWAGLGNGYAHVGDVDAGPCGLRALARAVRMRRTCS